MRTTAAIYYINVSCSDIKESSVCLNRTQYRGCRSGRELGFASWIWNFESSSFTITREPERERCMSLSQMLLKQLYIYRCILWMRWLESENLKRLGIEIFEFPAGWFSGVRIAGVAMVYRVDLTWFDLT